MEVTGGGGTAAVGRMARSATRGPHRRPLPEEGEMVPDRITDPLPRPGASSSRRSGEIPRPQSRRRPSVLLTARRDHQLRKSGDGIVGREEPWSTLEWILVLGA